LPIDVLLPLSILSLLLLFLNTIAIIRTLQSSASFRAAAIWLHAWAYYGVSSAKSHALHKIFIPSADQLAASELLYPDA